jgi:hypothetical protein
MPFLEKSGSLSSLNYQYSFPGKGKKKNRKEKKRNAGRRKQSLD